ncbi:TonB-dependent receptor [Pedobacter fastidiosus]|uniref:TonB-dependent receptor n=1 Tax=Pedobacter fastidiosus TaxID=2765361 RepID=A0ABR7KNM3_9SPHI|nr:TonB-dependent receptor [Pedobacter fastidiosus]MBC6109588.1 TonB-dependent receptor [Pedobacter fastidiosus]
MRTILFIVFIFCSFVSYSQSIIKGKIKSGQNDFVENANIILFKNNSDEVISYSISNEKGDFLISYPSSADSLRLEINCIGFAKLTKFLSNKPNQIINFSLQTAVNILPDVVVRQKSIQLNGDTISYNAKSFSDKSDRVILDVIKKIPGIKVTEYGQILFNNKPINKFYIEGKDLLEDRYNIASNNLPVDAVDQVQLLQNHQPIKLLKGLEQSDRAAINIKLNKDSKLHLLGNGHLGLGFSPFSTDNGLTLLKFKKNVQFINSLKYNNIGINLDQELNEQNYSVSLSESGSIKQDLVHLVKASTPPINQSRFWFNNNLLGSSNYLFGLSKLLDLKVNLAYENDRLTDTANSVTKIYLPEDTIIINENHIGLSSYSKILAGLTVQANTNKVYLKNSLKFQRVYSKAEDLISSGINQKLINPFINLINDLNSIINLENNLIGITSFTSFTNLPQNLSITPGPYEDILNSDRIYDKLFQTIQRRSFYTNNFGSFTKKLGIFSFANKFGITFLSQALENNLGLEENGEFNPVIGNFKNLIQRNRLKFYNDANLNLSHGRFNFSTGMKISSNTLINSNIDKKQKDNRWYLNPNISILYKPSTFWETNINLSTSNNFDNEYNASYILMDYRSLINNNVPLQETITKNLSYHIGYKNIINAVYSNLTVDYSKSVTNVLMSTIFDGVLNTKVAIAQNNPTNDLTFSWNINKYYLGLKTSFDLSLAYNVIKMNQLQQNVLAGFTSKTYSLGTNLTSKVGENITLKYILDLMVNKNSSKILEQDFDFTPIKLLKQDFNFKYFLEKDFQTNLSIEHYYNNAKTGKGLTYFFADYSFQKSISKPKLDFSATISNIFNTKTYSSYSYLNNIFINSDYTLRGRMFMFKVSFQF